ncbi:hypothetical protein EVAR_28562_1 [Eumeta japonica]|uniref:Transposable element Tc3 transposase n=1 Tax=Eumeta variegata TaxID=151549 RepID=A0A4C1UWQ8_EUMVA|nr:hypothetical protein EVAR_28562_1 [Eumeta japonica]
MRITAGLLMCTVHLRRAAISRIEYGLEVGLAFLTRKKCCKRSQMTQVFPFVELKKKREYPKAQHIVFNKEPKCIRFTYNEFNVFSLKIILKVNLWTGILNGKIIGPFELPENLNGTNYLHFLRENLPTLLEDVPLTDRRHMWSQQNGCPAHFAMQPARSPDLNPLDFFYWGVLKEKVYSKPIESVAELSEQISQAAEDINSRGYARLIRQSHRIWEEDKFPYWESRALSSIATTRFATRHVWFPGGAKQGLEKFQYSECVETKRKGSGGAIKTLFIGLTLIRANEDGAVLA